MKAAEKLSSMELRWAKLCVDLDCNTVFDSTLHRHCPACGSVEFYPLEAWLNREGARRATALVAPPRLSVFPGRRDGLDPERQRLGARMARAVELASRRARRFSVR